MSRDLSSILKLRVPVIVRLGHRQMTLNEVLELGPGVIIELPKSADMPLDLMVNNKVVGHGSAVKIGENFGIRVSAIGDQADRLQAMTTASESATEDAAEDSPSDDAPSDDVAAETEDEPAPAEAPA